MELDNKEIFNDIYFQICDVFLGDRILKCVYIIRSGKG